MHSGTQNRVFMPEHKIWVAAVDSDLTENGLVYPGLGDTVRDASLGFFLRS